MPYFYKMGFSVNAIIGVIFTYAITCLIIMKPVSILTHKLGVKKTFFLSAISCVGVFVSVVNISIENQWVFYIWMVINAWDVMLSRIPLRSYFARYGDNRKRGKQIGITKILEAVPSLIFPIIAGSMLDQLGIMILIGIKTTVKLLGIILFALGKKGDFKSEEPISVFASLKSIPLNFKKYWLLSNLTYPFDKDLFNIWVVLQFASFKAAGVFLSFKVLLEIALNILIGHLSDGGKIRKLFFFAVAISSIGWFFVPFISGSLEMFLFQFTIGSMGLFVEIPVEREIYNKMKESFREIEYSVAREVYVQVGLVISCLIAWTLVNFVSEWKYLFPLAALTVLPSLYIIQKVSKRELASLVENTGLVKIEERLIEGVKQDARS